MRTDVFWFVFLGLLGYALVVGPERAYSVIHPIHSVMVGGLMHILALLVLIFAVAIVFNIGLEAFFKGTGCLILVALVLLVAFPLSRLIIFSNPLGPVVGLAVILVIVGRVLMKMGE